MKNLFPWLLGSLLLCAVLSVSEDFVLENTAARQFAYDLIQRRLSQGRRAESLPVVVVDIEDVKLDDKQATDRVVLAKLISELASADVRGIGIDVDFSPDDNGFISRSDPGFFCFCRDLQEGKIIRGATVPVRLGVHRRAAGASFQWLGEEDFKDLAASIVMPEDPRLQPAAIRLKQDSQDVAPRVVDPRVQSENKLVALPSLAKALNDAAPDKPAARPQPLTSLRSRVATQLATRQLAVAEVIDFAVDYSAVDLLEESRLFVKNPAERPQTNLTCESVTIPDMPALLSEGEKERVRDRFVLIGIGRAVGGDRFVVPGSSEIKMRAGIYRQASALLTLREGMLWTIKENIGLPISIGIVLLVFAVRFTYRLFEGPPRLEHLLLILAALLVMGAAVVLVPYTRVFWDDSVVVALIILAHHPVEHWFKKWLNLPVARWRRARERIKKYLLEEEPK